MVVAVQMLTWHVPAATGGTRRFVVRSRRNRSFRGARVALVWSTFSSRLYFWYHAKMRSSQNSPETTLWRKEGFSQIYD